MKISKNKKVCAAKETNTVTDVKSKYQDTIDYIKAAIDSLGNIAQDDDLAKDAIANLSVVLLDLK